MAVVRNTLIVTAALTAPTVFVPPPLYAPPSEQSYAVRELQVHSQLGIAGKRIFAAECADCHRINGGGSEVAPSLLGTLPAGLKRQAFHSLVAQQHWKMTGMPPNPSLSFNEIEQVARYLRELTHPTKYR